jgi:hypothetical protein
VLDHGGPGAQSAYGSNAFPSPRGPSPRVQAERFDEQRADAIGLGPQVGEAPLHLRVEMADRGPVFRELDRGVGTS